MTKITESAIEDLAIGLFEKLGYQYIYDRSIAAVSDIPENKHVVMLKRLHSAVARINPDMPTMIDDLITEQQ